MRNKILTIIVFACLGFIIYSNTFRCSFHLDDENSIITNLSIRRISDPGAVWKFWPTRFITYLSVGLNYHFHKLDVRGYHLFNLVAHIFCAVLVYWFFLLTLRAPAVKGGKIANHAGLAAFFAGLIFLTHPVQTQGVTYIIQRAVSLTTFFYLASLCLYIKAMLLPSENNNSAVRGLFYFGSILSAVIAMFTKEIAVTLPLMILLYYFYFLKTKKGANYKYVIPFFVLFLIIPLTMILTKSIDFINMRRVVEDSVNISPLHYLFTQFAVMVTYIGRLFVPINQNLDYDYPIAKTLLCPPVLAGLFVLIFILFIAVRIFARHRLISFGICWFFLTLVPESSIIPIKDVIFEHRLYLPMVGYSIFLVSALYYFIGENSRIIMRLIILASVSWYSFLTYERNFIWNDDITLWSDVVNKSPKKARGYENRGFAYQIKGDFDKAAADYNEALKFNPFRAGTYSNLGIIYQIKGDIDSAIGNFNKALLLSPDLAGVYYNRGYAYQLKGYIVQAIADYSKAIEINPSYADAYNNRGNAYLNKGDFDKAMADYNKALKIDPGYAPAKYNRDKMYSGK